MKSKIVCIDQLVEKVNQQPSLKFIWQGIKEHTLNFIVAPSKVGKTTFCENLAMTIASGGSSFLNSPVWFGDNQTVLMVELEEHYINRTLRNKQQLNFIDKELENKAWHSNYKVLGEDAPRYFFSNKDWDWLGHEILELEPRVVVIDSLSRLHLGQSIEDSTVCIDLTHNLKEIVDKTGTTLIVIHHTHKMDNVPLTLANMAGSRVLAQEADAIIGLNKTPSGTRYIKPIAYRYLDDISDTVTTFKINNDGWLDVLEKADEGKLLREYDNRYDDSNKEHVLHFFQTFTKGENSITIKTSELQDNLVTPKIMSKPTLFKSLDLLIEEGEIEKVSKGEYTLASKN